MLEVKATLRISSREMTLPQLTSILGEPTSGYSSGDEYSKSKKKRNNSYWAWELPSKKNISLEKYFLDVLKILNDKEKELSLIRKKCEVDIFCMLSSDNGQGGAVFSSGLIQSLASYKIDVVLDIYMGE